MDAFRRASSVSSENLQSSSLDRFPPFPFSLVDFDHEAQLKAFVNFAWRHGVSWLQLEKKNGRSTEFSVLLTCLRLGGTSRKARLYTP